MLLNSQRGSSLVEVAIAFCVTGILMVALSNLSPLVLETQRARTRPALADTTQAAAAMLERELGNALPESIRVERAGDRIVIELAPMRTSGRYRSASSAASSLDACPADDPALDSEDPEADPFANDILSFNTPDSCFKTLGVLDTADIQSGDWLVMAGGLAADFYGLGPASGGSKSKIVSVATGVNESMLGIEPVAFSAAPASRRFAVAGEPRSWVCDPVAGTLSAYANYGLSAEQPLTFSSAPIVTLAGVKACSFSLEGRHARLGITMANGSTISPGGGSVLLSRIPL